MLREDEQEETEKTELARDLCFLRYLLFNIQYYEVLAINKEYCRQSMLLDKKLSSSWVD